MDFYGQWWKKHERQRTTRSKDGLVRKYSTCLEVRSHSQYVLQDRLCEIVTDDKAGKGDVLAKPIDLLWLIFHPTWDIVDYEAFAKMLQSYLTLCSPMDHSPPGSSVHGILQACVPEWVAMPSSRRSSWPRDQTYISYVSCIGRWVLYHQGHLGSPYVAHGYFMSQTGKLNCDKTLMLRHSPISKMLKYNPPKVCLRADKIQWGDWSSVLGRRKDKKSFQWHELHWPQNNKSYSDIIGMSEANIWG